MSYLTSAFLLVTSSVRSKQLLCFVQGQGKKKTRRTLTSFITIPLAVNYDPNTTIGSSLVAILSCRYVFVLFCFVLFCVFF